MRPLDWRSACVWLRPRGRCSALVYEASRQTLTLSLWELWGQIVYFWAIQGLCSSDVNISNVHPKDLSFVIAESFPTFIHCIMPNPEDPDRFQQNWHQQIQHWCIQMNWSPDQVKDLPYKTNELIPTRLPTPTRFTSQMNWFQLGQFPNQLNKFTIQLR